MRAAPLLAALAFLAPGCLLDEPQPREVTGPTEGYSPTQTYLKVHVRQDDGSIVLVDFDRKEWYTSGIARRIDELSMRELAVYAQPRNVLGEVLVLDVRAPEDLAELRYDAMKATAEERRLMDLEHDALLDKAAGAAKGASLHRALP